MSELLAHIGTLASQNLLLAYFIIYLSTIFLGNISAFAGFWFIFQGYFGQWGVPLLVLVIFLADMTGDLLWYSLGRATHGTRFGNWIKNHFPGYKKVAAKIENDGGRLIFFAKFLYAASFPVIFSIGWTQMPFKKFFENSILSILLWLPILLGLAYGVISGLSPLQAVSIFKDVQLVFVIGLVIFVVLDYLVARLLGKLFRRRASRTTVDDLFDAQEKSSIIRKT